MSADFLDVYHCQPVAFSPQRIRIDHTGPLSVKTLRTLIGAPHDTALLAKTAPAGHTMLWASALRVVHCTNHEKPITNIHACTLFNLTELSGDVVVVPDARLPHDLNEREPDQQQQQQEAPISFGVTLPPPPPPAPPAAGVPHFWIPPEPYAK